MAHPTPTLSTSVPGGGGMASLCWSLLWSPFWLHLLFEGLTSVLMVVRPAWVPLAQTSRESTFHIRLIGNLLLPLSLLVYRVARDPDASPIKQLVALAMLAYHAVSIVLVSLHVMTASTLGDVTLTSISSLAIHTSIAWLTFQYMRTSARQLQRHRPTPVPSSFPLSFWLHLLTEGPASLVMLLQPDWLPGSQSLSAESTFYLRGVGNLLLALNLLIARVLWLRASDASREKRLVTSAIFMYHIGAGVIGTWHMVETSASFDGTSNTSSGGWQDTSWTTIAALLLHTTIALVTWFDSAAANATAKAEPATAKLQR